MGKEQRFDENSNYLLPKLTCSLVTGILYLIPAEGGIKSMLIIILLIVFSIFWGAVNRINSLITVLLLWITLPFAGLVKMFLIPGHFMNSDNTFSFLAFVLLTLFLCFLGVYSSILVRSIANRARIKP